MFTLAEGVLFIVLSALYSLYSPMSWYTDTVGFSGVLFAMAVDEASLSPFPTRSVFGLFSVPTRVYPWVLMLILQLVMPNASLLGHLAGIIVGFVHTWGLLGWAIPSLPTLRRVEAWPVMARLVRTGPYKLVPNAEVVRGNATFGAFVSDVTSFLRCVLKPLTDCLGRARRSAARVSTTSDGQGVGGSAATATAPYTDAAAFTYGQQSNGDAEAADIEAAIAASLVREDGGAPATSPPLPPPAPPSTPVLFDSVAVGGSAFLSQQQQPQQPRREEAAARAAAAAMARLAAKGFGVGGGKSPPPASPTPAAATGVAQPAAAAAADAGSPHPAVHAAAAAVGPVPVPEGSGVEHARGRGVGGYAPLGTEPATDCQEGDGRR